MGSSNTAIIAGQFAIGGASQEYTQCLEFDFAAGTNTQTWTAPRDGVIVAFYGGATQYGIAINHVPSLLVAGTNSVTTDQVYGTTQSGTPTITGIRFPFKQDDVIQVKSTAATVVHIWVNFPL